MMSVLSVFSHFFLDFYVSFFNPLGPFIIQKFPIEVRMLTSFLALSSATASLFQIFFGFFFDRVKYTKSLLFTMYVMEALGISLIGLSTNFWMFIAAVFVVRIANSAFHPLGASMAGEVGGRTVAVFSIAGTLGAALGPVFISLYVSHFPIESLWLVALPAVVLALFLLRINIPNRTVHSQKFDLKEVMKLLPILLVVTVRSFLMSVVHTYTPIYITNVRHYSISLSGLLITSGMIAGVFANYLGVVLMEKIGAKKQDLVAFIGMGLTIFWLISSKGIASIFISFVLFDFFGFLLMSANVVQAQKILPNRKALASSVAMGFAWSLGDFIATGYNSVVGNNIILSLGLAIPVAFVASIYFGIVQKFDTK
ncbi:MFS transporter, FSR family, fosmidomycin resistance protein [Fervidobacterium changbaicum]|nr:MFS transporter, FSR family, fosmidomycin resistance protein [Fervidobacterium changbaicum]